MISTNTYLNFPGTCEEAMNFYAKLLGGTVLAMARNAGSPMEAQVPAEWRNKIIHARVKIGDVLLMASDAPASYYKPPQGFSVNISVDAVADAERVFAGLSHGGNVTMAMQETFWAHRFGACVDR
ncbi:MAG TPA: VOC family protein, partial [Rhizomicrobium sp.]|nr:VOC family protein [Rhizomicrobium sp.]